MPFDRFAVEQLAGDLLPNPTLDQRIATGFVRSNTTTNENGVIEEEVRFQYIKDRADTTGTVFLGLTVGCATCHDHKFDPISQKDHYALEAFFNNTTERMMDNNRPDPPPIVIVPDERDRARWLELEALRKSLRVAYERRARRRRTRGSTTWVRSASGGRCRIRSVDAEVLAVSAGRDCGVRVRRAGAGADAAARTGRDSRVMPLPGPGLRVVEVRWHVAPLKLPAIDLTGDEPFSMTAWVLSSEDHAASGADGRRPALVIASQMTAGDAASTPPVPATGWVVRNRRRRRAAAIDRRRRQSRSARRRRITSPSKPARGIT